MIVSIFMTVTVIMSSQQRQTSAVLYISFDMLLLTVMVKPNCKQHLYKSKPT